MAIWVSAAGAPQIPPPRHVDGPYGCWGLAEAPSLPRESERERRHKASLRWTNWVLILCMGGTAWLLVGGLAMSLYHRAHSAALAKTVGFVADVPPKAPTTPPASNAPPADAAQPPKPEQKVEEKKAAAAPPATAFPVSRPPAAPPPDDQLVKAPELPSSELTANEEMIEPRNYGTKLDLVDNPQAAARLALKQKKLLFVLHLSGNFEDDKFT
jgi:hypothetical protein